MRVVILDAPPSLIAERRRLGHDRWDEVWEGELHMVPPPAWAHNRVNDALGVFFRIHWEDLGLGRTCAEVGVKRPGAGFVRELGENVPSDYRTPDRSFLLPERYDRVQGGWIVGGPDAVLEIVSPADESRAKLPFYFSIGVRAVVLVDRDSRDVEVFRAGASSFESVAVDAGGWIRCEALRTELRRDSDPSGKVVLLVRRFDELERMMSIGD